ncbi:MAG: hypothetical protein Q8891_04595 [Bacteroidota bacterium]|nr:hypothetical protein [Bacteroidota bacterium]
MDQIHNLKLIEGQFAPLEARKVIFDLINSKINYHNLEAFSIKERFNGNISYSEKRIEELKEVRRRLEDIVNDASERGLNLEVESFIKITLIEDA